MYRTTASSVGGVVEATVGVQSVGGNAALWAAVLGTCAALLGASVVRQRRASASEPTAVASRSEPTPPGLTDEERVVELLESNGGRLRQTRIVERTDWSKSKVSMLLSEMEADGRLHKLRVGRENVVSLPGSEPIVADVDAGSERDRGRPIGEKRNG